MSELTHEKDETGREGFCPFCQQREGPLRIGHVKFWFCSAHRLHLLGLHSTTVASAAEDAETRQCLRETTTLRPSRAWRPPAVLAEIQARMAPEAVERLWPPGHETKSMVVEWPTPEDR